VTTCASRFSILVLGSWLVACASEPSASQPNAPEPNVADEGMAGYGGDDEEIDPTSEPYVVADPEEALAAIPAEMQPAQLSDELKTKLLVPNLERGGRAMFTDVVTIEPGQDITFCTYVEHITEEVTYLHDTLGSQTSYGHHAILQYLTKPQEPGTRACPAESDLDAQLSQVLGGTGGEGNGAIVLPANVVSEIPAGVQFVINHHWINVGEEPIEAQAEMITIPAETDEDLVIARAMAIVVADFNVPPGERGEASSECTFDKDTLLLSMLGHQHQWGTHVKAERMGDDAEMIFDHDYTPDMISQPITTDFSLDAPFRFAAGDKVRMSCEWNNTSDAALVFPREMCILFGWQIGAEHDSTCYGGAWL